MIASMTAFGRGAAQEEWGQAIWELRSVNHRYLDLSFKIPDNFRSWETSWRNLLGEQLQRGKIECQLTFIPGKPLTPHFEINQHLVDQLISSCQVLARYPEVDPRIKATNLLTWPGVLIPCVKDISILKAPLTTLLGQAAQELVQSRQREGEQLRQILQEKLSQVLKFVMQIRARSPRCLTLQREKMLQRLQEIKDLDPQRLECELVLYAQRIDVEEEIDRLNAHARAVSHALEGSGAHGRRLDFLMQEMNREANTLAAKASDDEIANIAIELKVLIEQMREQIQNVE